MTRILLADDQAPDPKMDHLSDAELRQHYLKYEHQEFVEEYERQEFAEGFVFMRELVKTLRVHAYKVDCANTPEETAKKCAEPGNIYDAIILDLGWYTVTTMLYDKRMLLGWDIAEKLRQHQSAPILMFSSRFLKNERLAQSTADKGLLPVYKTSDAACADHLLVTVRWAASSRSAAEVIDQQRKLLELRVDQEEKLRSLRTYRWLSDILLGSIVLSVALMAVTVVFMLVYNDKNAASVSSVLGLLSTFISSVIYQFIRYYRRGLAPVPPPRRAHNS
jgi:CheY-like chemotaxis protein